MKNLLTHTVTCGSVTPVTVNVNVLDGSTLPTVQLQNKVYLFKNGTYLNGLNSFSTQGSGSFSPYSGVGSIPWAKAVSTSTTVNITPGTDGGACIISTNCNLPKFNKINIKYKNTTSGASNIYGVFIKNTSQSWGGSNQNDYTRYATNPTVTADLISEELTYDANRTNPVDIVIRLVYVSAIEEIWIE